MQVNEFNHLLPQSMVKGDIIRLQTSDKSHWNTEAASPASADTAKNFSDAFNLAIQKVNDLQVDADDMSQKMVSDPKSVSVHTLMIAQEKARMALTLTKDILDLAVKTYRELVNLR